MAGAVIKASVSILKLRCSERGKPVEGFAIVIAQKWSLSNLRDAGGGCLVPSEFAPNRLIIRGLLRHSSEACGPSLRRLWRV